MIGIRTSKFLSLRFGRKDPISHSGFAKGKSVGRVHIDNVQDLFVSIFGECRAGTALVTIYVDNSRTASFKLKFY